MKDSGAVQVQLVSAIEPDEEGQVQFTWSLSLTNGNTMLIKIEFEQPEFISSSGVDRDELRIFFVETDSYIQCLPI